MTRFSHYNSNNNSFQNISNESRNSERVAEVNRNVNDVRSELLTLKIMVQAMMEIMVEKGIDPDTINAKINEIAERPETFDAPRTLSKPCPKCGRLILDNGSTPLTGTCLYCGTVVRFSPRFAVKNKEESPE